MNLLRGVFERDGDEVTNHPVANDNVFVRMVVVTIAILTAIAVLPAIPTSIPWAQAQTSNAQFQIDPSSNNMWGNEFVAIVGRWRSHGDRGCRVPRK